MQSTSPISVALSLIIPVYNRPQEIDELLESLTKQHNQAFEVVIVEDGSSLPCFDIVQRYQTRLAIQYFAKENSGPGQSRNYGAERANGNYYVFLDSDCIIPPHYTQTLVDRITAENIDAFGGPDKADPSFSAIQKAINYAMTSFFTTGGIRGGSEKMDKFYPRSFNMGYSKDVYRATNGFSTMRFGEDIDMSIRIMDQGFTTKLITDAYVYHKRRTNFKQFFRQVFNSGIARIILEKRHPGTLKLVHMLPSVFVLGCAFLLVVSLFWKTIALVPLLLLSFIYIIDAYRQSQQIQVALLALPASFIQLWGYGLGFLLAYWNIVIKKGKEFSAFGKTFYD